LKKLSGGMKRHAGIPQTMLNNPQILIIVPDIEYIANEILMMKDGTIVNNGTLDEIIGAMPEKVRTCLVPQKEVQQSQKNTLCLRSAYQLNYFRCIISLTYKVTLFRIFLCAS